MQAKGGSGQSSHGGGMVGSGQWPNYKQNYNLQVTFAFINRDPDIFDGFEIIGYSYSSELNTAAGRNRETNFSPIVTR